MSLATRCPACGTVFRVVRDQLKVSEGWVRCGRCSEVFNAGERLFELDPVTAAPAVNPPSAAPPPAATDSAVVAVIGATLPRTPPVEAPVEDPMPDAQAPAATAAAPTVQERRDEAPPVPEQEPALQPEALADVPEAPAAPDTPPAESLGTHTTPPAAPTEMPAEPSLDMRPVAPVEPVEPQQAATLDLRADPAAVASQPTPGFMRRAERAERWRHPLRRNIVTLLCLVLLATLAGQMAMHYRDDLSARWPATTPWLQGACRALGCSVEPPRHIDSLAVDSSGLVRVDDSALYRLSLVVQNRSATAVRMPSIDLALTDAQGRTTVRRVLSAAELGHAADSLPPRGEVALQAMLELVYRHVAGYTVELFYP